MTSFYEPVITRTRDGNRARYKIAVPEAGETVVHTKGSPPGDREPKQSACVFPCMVSGQPNIQDKHFEYDRESEEFTCKTCGSTHSEMDAIMHLMKVHGYNHIDIILDEPKDD